MDPRIENGMFHQKGKGGVEYYPKTILLNTELNVLHEHELGYKQEGDKTYKFRDKRIKENNNLSTNFPYGVSATTGADKPPAFTSTVTEGPDGIVRRNKIPDDPSGVARSLSTAGASRILKR
jgi:hypothetical protein